MLPKASRAKAPERANIRAFLKLMLPYMLQHKYKLPVIAALIIVSNFMLLSIPRYTGNILDAIGIVQGKADFDAVFLLSAKILLFALAAFALECIRNSMMVRISHSIIYELRKNVFGHLLQLPLSFLESNKKGDIISRITMDIDQISETITSDAEAVLAGLVTVTGALFMMLRISPILALILVVILPSMVLIARFISQKSRKRYRQKKISFGALSAHAEEMIAAQKTIKLFGLEQYNKTVFDNYSTTYEKTAQSAEFTSSTMMPMMNLCNNISFLLISICGCLLFLGGKTSIGSISSFIVYSKKFTAPIVEAANMYGTFQSALSSCDRINYLLSQPVEQNPENAMESGCINGDICFDNVCFSYLPNTPVIKDVSFRVRPGQKVAIVGETGSGKTTLVNLLMRFYQPNSGSITIDGIDVQHFSLSFLRRRFALVLQQSFLFEMSVADNIDYAAQSHDRQRVLNTLEAVALKDFVMGLPNGLDTLLVSDSGLLSQGQKQLLTIGRAMMTDASMIIFDEATSSVDTLTEEKIREVTEQLMQGRTSFVIAHRLSTIRTADLILVMEHGRLVEQGTHQELLEQNGVYAQMHYSQFQSV